MSAACFAWVLLIVSLLGSVLVFGGHDRANREGDAAVLLLVLVVVAVVCVMIGIHD